MNENNVVSLVSYRNDKLSDKAQEHLYRIQININCFEADKRREEYLKSLDTPIPMPVEKKRGRK